MKTAVFSPKDFLLGPALWDFDNDFMGLGNIVKSATPTHLKETDEAFFFTVDMPGVDKKGLDIQVEGDHIVIQAVRKDKFASDDNSVAKISKRVLIPGQVDKKKIQARCENGVLYLALPKATAARPQKVEISEGPANGTWNKLLGEAKT